MLGEFAPADYWRAWLAVQMTTLRLPAPATPAPTHQTQPSAQR